MLVKHSTRNFYMAYKHINPSSSLKVNDSVTTSTILGDIQNIKGAHLHFGLTTNNTSNYGSLIWANNSQGYSHVTSGNWFNGRGLDFIKNHFIQNGHVLEIFAYASDDENQRLYPEKVVLWHKKRGAQTWSGPVSMRDISTTTCTPINKEETVRECKYSINFGTLGYYNNDGVDWLVVAYRARLSSNNWAFYPAYYATPAERPDSNSKFFTTYLTNLPEPWEIKDDEELEEVYE